MDYTLTTLPNGLRIIAEHMPSIRSASIGCWVDAGSRDERPVEAGASHFLEHLLFKGSEDWSARRIAETFDAIGARHNAFTSKEYTCFWTRTRDADVPIGIEVLGEMLQRPSFRQEEIDSERNVVLEEINMNEDDPTDVAHEQFIEAIWESHPLAPPILGTPESINAMSRDTIAEYWGKRYTPESTVIAAAGNLPDNLIEMLTDAFGGWEGGGVDRETTMPIVESRARVRTKDTEQAHLIFGSPSIVRDDDRRFALTLADHVLGGGMSSRLFREIRETRGLAYAVHSFRMPFLDAGASAVYVGTTPSQTDEVLTIVRSEIEKVINDGITEEELERAKGNIKGSLALGLEDANSRMTRLGRTELTGMEHLTVDETVERIAAIDNEDVKAAAKVAYSGPYVLGAVGPFAEEDFAEHIS
ncbi:MAG: insulinase family protein [Proteobacteria bacterium]|nr:insulinase family protein [Pseudomonadota bacterium]